jgi:hypothetical protein
LYKKRRTHEPTHNDEEAFAQQLFNFMRKKTPQYVVQMPVPKINLDLDGTVQPFAPSSVGSTLNKDKYPMDDIKDSTPCTVVYIKGRTSKTIEIVKAIVMSSCIHHGRPIPTECVVVEVTMIREGHEFEDLDYPNEEEGIEKLVDAKRTFITWPRKDIIVKTRLLLIVSPRSTEAGDTPTSNISSPAQDPHIVAPPPAHDPEIKDSMGEKATFSSYSRPS